MSTLEPTDEQLSEAAAALASHAELPGPDAIAGAWEAATILWPIIRDMVLESAGKECDAFVGEYNATSDFAAATLGDRLRAMKGPKP